jgi:hypothetical protein
MALLVLSVTDAEAVAAQTSKKVADCGNGSRVGGRRLGGKARTHMLFSRCSSTTAHSTATRYVVYFPFSDFPYDVLKL